MLIFTALVFSKIMLIIANLSWSKNIGEILKESGHVAGFFLADGVDRIRGCLERWCFKPSLV